MELTLRRQKILFLSFYVSGTLTTSKWPAKLKVSIFWKEEDLRAKEASKRRPEGQKRGAHTAPVPGRVGPTQMALVALLPSIFVPVASSWPKNAYIRSPPTFFETSVATRQKQENRDLELQIGGGKLRRGAAGEVSFFSIDISTVSMIKRE